MKKDDMIVGADERLEALLVSAVTDGRLQRIRQDLTVYDYLTYQDKEYQVIAETVDGYFLCEQTDEAA